jgi:hypothetical protein
MGPTTRAASRSRTSAGARQTTTHDLVPPRIRTRARLTAAMALGYGTFRLTWVLGERPWLPPKGDDLLMFSDWGIVVLCAAAALLAVAFARRRPGAWTAWLVPVAAAVDVVLLAACALLLLDAVGLLIPGSGIQIHVGAILTRLGCLAVAATLASTTTLWQRHHRRRCPACGRDPAWVAPPPTPPPMVFAAAYAVVLAFLVRVGAQVVVDVGSGSSIADATDPASLAIFVGGAALAGTLLPLALVQRWGRVWPRWTGPLSGRRVPRWLVLGPGLVIGVGMTIYFAISLLALSTGASRTRPAASRPPSSRCPCSPTWCGGPASPSLRRPTGDGHARPAPTAVSAPPPSRPTHERAVVTRRVPVLGPDRGACGGGRGQLTRAPNAGRVTPAG